MPDQVGNQFDEGPTKLSTKEKKQEEDEICQAGARNTADCIDSWPSYRDTMVPVAEILEMARANDEDLQHLCQAFGEYSTREPPAESSVSRVRQQIGVHLGLSKDEAEMTHFASPWRWQLVKQITQKTQDDQHIATWLSEGAPVGINRKIKPGGLLPMISESTEASKEEILSGRQFEANHRSFDEELDPARPAHKELTEMVDKGFAILFHDQASAEAWLGCKTIASPLGNVTQVKPDGRIKHRLITDQKASRVNNLSCCAERQVLPRFGDHALDIALAGRVSETAKVMVLDFAHAFMTIPLHDDEMAVSCTNVPEGMSRTRDPVIEKESKFGYFLVWRVLGFGGHANPLVYSRIATFSARSAQALFPDNVRMQLYVDDPAVVVCGTDEGQEVMLDCIILWWMVLGIPLAWLKGLCRPITEVHYWIGVGFRLVRPGVTEVSLPWEFREKLSELLAKVLTESTISDKEAEILCGRAARLAQVIPACQAWVSQLYGAYYGGIKARAAGHKEAPPHKLATSRFTTACRWLWMITGDHPDAPVSLRSWWHAVPRPRPALAELRVEIDACPWGGGGILFLDDAPDEYFYAKWCVSDLWQGSEVVLGDPKYQTFWEYLTLGT